MAIILQVETTGHQHGMGGQVVIDATVMEQEGIGVGDTIVVKTSSGKFALAHVGTPKDGDEGRGYIRLDRGIRGAIKTTIGSMVEIEPAEVEVVKSVKFAPLSDVSGVEAEQLSEYIKESFVARGKLVNRGVIEYISLPGKGSATAFKVLESDPESGIVDKGTDVDVEYAFDTWGTARETTFDDVGGLGEELQHIRELIEYPIKFPDVYQEIGINPARGVLLFGPPGTGKTLMTKAISNELDANFHYINGPSIISAGYGETEGKLRSIFDAANHSLPSIILIDEIDAIAPNRDDTGSFTDLRVTTQLLELMDGLQSVQGVMVVATTNRIDAIEPALRRPGRFDRELYVGPPNEDARKDILGIHTRGMLLEENFSEAVPDLAQRMNGYTGADIRELAREAGVNALRRQFPSEGPANREEMSLVDLVVTVGDFEHALRTVQPSVLRGPLSRDSKMTMENIGGLKEAKVRLHELIKAPQENAETFAKMGIETPPGILIVGPPGTGKTALAQAAGNDLGATFLQVESSDIFSEWVGRSEKAIKETFLIARRAAPSVILIDNIDAMARRIGEGGGESVSTRVINQLLTEMDGLREHDVKVIGTTDRIEDIDESLLSPSRFGEVIHLPKLSVGDREEVIKIHLQGVETRVTKEEIKSISKKSEGWSGGRLASLCEEAKLSAIREEDYKSVVVVEGKHLENALKKLSD
ncbi:AAA family ATPase [Candidatus Hikarchaeum yamanae]|uniref:AAA family ATPase n=1 Tax=Candidatus Hikarchaeum yamanae TaxID=2675326 RepID=UPI0039E8B064|tara:strand:+ start:4354 stop:6456 length:2103 start_codon:yes stop_codon:yes gene_type:complete